MKSKEYCKNLRDSIKLGFVLAKANFKLKNEGSYFGIFWYLLNPILTFVLTFSIFNDRLGGGIPKYPLYLLLGIVMFNLFQNSASRSMGLITGEYAAVIKSINFNKEAIVFGAVFENIFAHLFEAALLVAVFIFYGADLILMIYHIPILAVFTFFIIGFCFLASSINVYFSDLSSAWGFLSKIIWLVTPLFYAIGGQTRLFYLNLANPVYYFITIARESIIYGRMPQPWLICGALLWGFGLLFAGLFVFNRLKSKFAELI